MCPVRAVAFDKAKESTFGTVCSLIIESRSNYDSVLVRSANASALSLFGYSIDEIRGKNAWELFADHEVERIKEVLLNGEPQELQFEVHPRDKAGVFIPVHLEILSLDEITGTGRAFVWNFLRAKVSEYSHKRQEIFAELAHRLSAVKTRKEAAYAMLDAAERLFGWDAAVLNLYPNDKNFTDSVINIDLIEGKKKEFPPLPSETPISPMSHRVLTEGPYLLDSEVLAGEPNQGLISFGDETQPSKSAMYVPIRRGEDRFGVASIHSYTPGAYGESELRLFQILVDYCSGALDRTQSEDQLRRQARITKKLAELGQSLASAGTPIQAARVIVGAADDLFSWDSCYVSLYSEKDRTEQTILAFDTINGERREFQSNMVRSVLSTITSRVLKEGSFLINRREAELKSAPPEGFGDSARPSASLLYAPIRIGTRKVGILSIQSYRPRAYNNSDIDTLQSLADHCGAALVRSFAEMSLRESEERLRLVLEQIPSIMWTVDKDLKFTMIQGAGLRFFHSGKKEILGKHLSKFLNEGSDSEIVLKMNSSALTGRSGTYEFRFGDRVYNCYVEPLFDSDKDVIGCINIGHDITKRIKVEEELREAHADLERRVEVRTEELSRINSMLKLEVFERRKTEEKHARSLSMLKATLEATTDGIVAVDRKGCLINWNSMFRSMWSLGESGTQYLENMELQTVLNSFLKSSGSFIEQYRDLVREPEDEFSSILELKDGRVLECYSRPRYLSGEVVGRVWSFRDVTLRRKAEEALVRSEETYRQAIENSSGVPYRMTRGKESYDFMGSGLKKLIGIEEDVMSKRVLSSMIRERVILDPQFSDHDEYSKAFFEGVLERYQLDMRIETSDGRNIWLNDCSVPLRDDETGVVIGSLGILQDITQRKNAEEEFRYQQERLNQAEKLVALGTLVSGVAHEINNPNNFIMLNAPILYDVWKDSRGILDKYAEHNGTFLLGGLDYEEVVEEVPGLFEGLIIGSQRIQSIVQELKDFARPTHEGFKELVDLDSVIRSSLVLMNNTIEKATSQFEYIPDKNLPLVEGHYQKIEQVLINLLQNSCQALTEKSKAIRVKTSHLESEGCVKIEVMDEGIGIPEEIGKQIMDPFYTTKRQSGGTGLGLSICSKIIHDHQGIISFESKEGEGTSFIIQLPAFQSSNEEHQ